MTENIAEIDAFFADNFTAQASNYSATPSGGSLTYAQLSEALDKIYNAPMPPPHGSEEDPHLYHPRPGFFYHRYCATCGLPREWLPAGAATEDLVILSGLR